MKTIVLLWSIVSALIAGFTGEAAGAAESTAITLTNGTKLTLLGVTYGRHHMAPGYEKLATANWIHTPINDTTVVWLEIEHDPKQWPSYALLISDKANTACITSEATTRSHVREGVEVHGFILKAYPRWEKDITLRIASPYCDKLSDEKFVIANPQLRSFGNEIVNPLPNRQSDGDVEVTLTKLSAGAPLEPYRRRKSLSLGDPQNKCVRIAFDLKQEGKSVTNWHPWLVDISDAVGNHVGTSMQYQDNDFIRQHTIRSSNPIVYGTNDEYKGYYFLPGLWPDEPAWKVRLEFTRNSGFEDSEILTVTNVPVHVGTKKDYDDEWSGEPVQTDLFLGDYTVNGIQLKLLVPIFRPDEINGGNIISVIMKADPNRGPLGMRITLLKATDDQGRELWSPFNPMAGSNCTFSFPNARPTKTLNLQFALHKSRFVEFTVKPQKQ